MADIMNRAPALRPGRLQPLKGGKKKGKGTVEAMFSAVLAERNNRIKELETELKFCNQMMSKSEKLDLRKRRKRAFQLDTDGEKELVERLFYNEILTRKRKAEERSEKLMKTETTFRSPEELEATTSRLYTDALRKKEETTQKLKLELDDQFQMPKTLILEDGAIAELALRFSTREVESRKAKRQNLINRYIPPSEPTQKLSSEAQNAANERLFNKSVESKQSSIEKLRLKFTPEPVVKRLTAAQQSNMAIRLSTSPGGG